QRDEPLDTRPPAKLPQATRMRIRSRKIAPSEPCPTSSYIARRGKKSGVLGRERREECNRKTGRREGIWGSAQGRRSGARARLRLFKSPSSPLVNRGAPGGGPGGAWRWTGGRLAVHATARRLSPSPFPSSRLPVALKAQRASSVHRDAHDVLD